MRVCVYVIMSAHTFFCTRGIPNPKHQVPRTRVGVGLRFYALEYLNFIDTARRRVSIRYPNKPAAFSSFVVTLSTQRDSSRRIRIPVVNRAYATRRRRATLAKDTRRYNFWRTHAYITILRLSHRRVFHLLLFFFYLYFFSLSLFFQRVNGFYAAGSLNRTSPPPPPARYTWSLKWEIPGDHAT